MSVMRHKSPPKIAKHTAKDSVFTDLFKKLPFLLQMYQALHPEDNTASEEDLKIITIQNILVNQMYNDLGFLVRDRLIILVECQSIWAINIVLRLFLYLAQTYKDYISENHLNVHSKIRIALPKPELYVIYTGEPFEAMPEEISLADEFFGGDRSVVDVKAKIIYDGRKGDIINQYCTFTRIYKDQVKRHGWTRKAAWETIRICMEQDVLRESLEDREKEVLDIMSTLFDQESALKAWEYEILQEANQRVIQAQRLAQEQTKQAQRLAQEQTKQAQRRAQEQTKQAQRLAQEQAKKQVEEKEKTLALNFYNLGIPIESISTATGIPQIKLQEWFTGYKESKTETKFEK